MIAAEDVVEVPLLPAQADALCADEPWVGYFGGIGAGKTHLLCYWMGRRALEYPQGVHVVTALTYDQLALVIEPRLIETFADWGVAAELKTGPRRILLDTGAQVICRSVDRPEPLRGIEIDSLGADEFDFYKPEAVRVLVGRLRGRRADRARMLVCSSPNGYREGYRMFAKEPSERPELRASRRLVQARTRDNWFLPEEYVGELEAAYASVSGLCEQELEGRFVNIGSRAICPTFDRTRHVRELKLDPLAPTFVALDWNVGKIACLVAQEAAGEIRIVREIRRAMTQALAEALIETLTFRRTNGQPWIPTEIEIHGDAGQGAERSVQTGRTVWDDFLTRVAALRPRRAWPTSNPRVVERVVATTTAFEKLPIFIDPSCVETIADLEQCQWAKDGAGIDDSNPERGHCFDALGYYIHRRHAPRAFRRPDRPLDYDLKPVGQYRV